MEGVILGPVGEHVQVGCLRPHGQEVLRSRDGATGTMLGEAGIHRTDRGQEPIGIT